MSLLVGGLLVLVLDLGRPDRLIIAMTYYNFKSIFAWNIFLYTGLLVVVAVYLWMMFEPRMNRFIGGVGKIAWGIGLWQPQRNKRKNSLNRIRILLTPG